MKVKFKPVILFAIIAALFGVTIATVPASAASGEWETEYFTVSPAAYGSTPIASGKKAEELQTNVTFTKTGDTTAVANGSLKFVTGYTQFEQSNQKNQYGHYLAFKIAKNSATKEKISELKVGRNIDATISKDSDDIVLRVDTNSTSPKMTPITITVKTSDQPEQTKTYTIDLNQLQLENKASDFIKIKEPENSTNNLPKSNADKKPSDIQSNIKITEDGMTYHVTGTLKYIKDWNNFSSGAKGNFLGLAIDGSLPSNVLKDDKVTVKQDSKNTEWKTSEKDPIVLQIADKNKPITIDATDTNDQKHDITLDLSGLVCEQPVTITYNPGEASSNATNMPSTLNVTDVLTGVDYTVSKGSDNTNDPKWDGYTFMGWKNSVDGKVYFKDDKFKPTADTTLTAQWVKKLDNVEAEVMTATEATVSDGVPEGNKKEVATAAGKTTVSKADFAELQMEAVGAVANQIPSDLSAVKAQLKTALAKNTGEQSKVDNQTKIFVETYIDVECDSYNPNIESKPISYDITPMAQVVATTATSTSDIKLSDVTSDQSQVNAIPVGTPVELHPQEDIELTIGLPNGYKTQDQDVYIQHKEYEYTAKCKDNSGTMKVTFVNPHGFSLFTVTTTSTSVASVNGNTYPNFQDALNNAGDNVITITGDCGTQTISKAGTFKIKLQGQGKINLLAGAGFHMEKVSVEADGTTTYTVVADPQSDRPTVPENNTDSCIVTFEGCGGTWADGSYFQNVNVKKGGNVVAPQTPVYPGYKFNGWYVDINGVQTQVDPSTYVVATDVVLRAHWVKVDSSTTPDPTPTVEKVPVYRLYNKYSGEHLFTTDANEKNQLCKIDGWKFENVAWNAAKSSNSPVYRLFNRFSGEHLYTRDTNEVNNLTKINGWKREGIAWYSDDARGQEVYRLYNRYAPGNAAHHYTTDSNEYNKLGNIGWQRENIVWYGVK